MKKTCPVCKNIFEESVPGQTFCAGGHCANSHNLIPIVEPASGQDLPLRQLYATQSLATLILWSMWASLISIIGLIAAYLPVAFWDGSGEQPIYSSVFALLMILAGGVVALIGLIKASDELSRSRIK